jgi:hypothetical protein
MIDLIRFSFCELTFRLGWLFPLPPPWKGGTKPRSERAERKSVRRVVMSRIEVEEMKFYPCRRMGSWSQIWDVGKRGDAYLLLHRRTVEHRTRGERKLRCKLDSQ